MYPTKYSEVNNLIEALLSSIQKIFGTKLTSVFLEGSLVIGDFDPNISDIDLVVVLSSDVTDGEFTILKKMYDDLISQHPEWYDRIETVYISKDALSKVKTDLSSVVNISPGEPIHWAKTSKRWILSWYISREKATTLYGPSPKKLIEPISREEYIDAVKTIVQASDSWVDSISKNNFSQSYAILTMCRALYSYKFGDQVSKIQAALWAKKELPEWSEVIDNALLWRNGPKHSEDNVTDFPKTQMFVKKVREIILNEAIKSSNVVN